MWFGFPPFAFPFAFPFAPVIWPFGIGYPFTFGATSALAVPATTVATSPFPFVI